MSETNHDHQENGFRPGVASSETVRASAHRRSSYSLFGCVPAEPNSASLDKIIIPNQILKLRLDFHRGSYPGPNSASSFFVHSFSGAVVQFF